MGVRAGAPDPVPERRRDPSADRNGYRSRHGPAAPPRAPLIFEKNGWGKYGSSCSTRALPRRHLRPLLGGLPEEGLPPADGRDLRRRESGFLTLRKGSWRALSIPSACGWRNCAMNLAGWKREGHFKRGRRLRGKDSAAAGLPSTTPDPRAWRSINPPLRLQARCPPKARREPARPTSSSTGLRGPAWPPSDGPTSLTTDYVMSVSLRPDRRKRVFHGGPGHRGPGPSGGKTAYQGPLPSWSRSGGLRPLVRGRHWRMERLPSGGSERVMVRLFGLLSPRSARSPFPLPWRSFPSVDEDGCRRVSPAPPERALWEEASLIEVGW